MAVGVEIVVAVVVELNPVDGLHTYVFAPLAVSVVVPGRQTEVLVAETESTGFGLTVRFTNAESNK